MLVADTNRDGKITAEDIAGHSIWAPGRGAFVFVNNNDSDFNGVADFADIVVNGLQDQSELTELNFSTSAIGNGNLIELENATVSFEILPALAQARLNLFVQKGTELALLGSAESVALPANGEIKLFAEAREFASADWNGIAQIKATVLDARRNLISTDTASLRASPFFLMANTLPARQLFVRDRGESNANFIAQIQNTLLPLGVGVTVAPKSPVWQDMWMQNTMKFGYSQMPSSAGVQSKVHILAARRGPGLDAYPDTLLAPDRGVFSAGKIRQHLSRDSWADWFGNLDVSPALSGFPHGRFYYGNSGTASLNPELVAMLNAQGVQGPGVELDTSWLFIKHVDELISFLPGPGGSPVMLIMSPAEGVRMLNEVRKYAPGNAMINRGLKTQTTLDAILADTAFLQHNLDLQARHLNALEAKLMREFRLVPSQVIRVPGLFNADGSGWTPNLVNSNLINNVFLASDPRFPIVNGVDYLQWYFAGLIARTGMRVQFLDDVYYHEAKGNTYCSTIAQREPPAYPFWNSYWN